MQDAIGGYFGLEKEGIGNFLHSKCAFLNSGRNALLYILKQIKQIHCLYIPYYTCNAILEPIQKLNISYKQYHINYNLEINDYLQLNENEYIIVNNYFGIKDEYIKKLLRIYKDKLIIDNSQALFFKLDANIKCFYSLRKFIGVPDGGLAYCNDIDTAIQLDEDDVKFRKEHLYIRNLQGAEAGFKIYKENEEKMINRDLMQISSFTKNMLQYINYENIIKIRNENFKYLHDKLKVYNYLNLDNLDFMCPQVYPLYIHNANIIRQKLYENKIYPALYWSNVLEDCDISTNEYKLAKYIIALPIDQRYNKNDMEQIIKLIKN